jgi:hypothetical protein
MRPIRVQLCIGWIRIAGTSWITAGDGSRPEMDDKRWIPSGEGSGPDMNSDRIRMDDRRWISGDGSRETEGNQSPTLSMIILRLCEVIPFSRSLTVISSNEVTIERRYADKRCTAGGLVPASTIPTTT